MHWPPSQFETLFLPDAITMKLIKRIIEAISSEVLGGGFISARIVRQTLVDENSLHIAATVYMLSSESVI